MFNPVYSLEEEDQRNINAPKVLSSPLLSFLGEKQTANPFCALPLPPSPIMHDSSPPGKTEEEEGEGGGRRWGSAPSAAYPTVHDRPPPTPAPSPTSSPALASLVVSCASVHAVMQKPLYISLFSE